MVEMVDSKQALRKNLYYREAKCALRQVEIKKLS